jgi:hypothetical protein
MKRLPFLLILVLALSMVGCGSKPSNRITNVTASAVLDGGSYVVTLGFSTNGGPLRLLITNPQRRMHPDEIVYVLNEQDRTTEALRSDNAAGKLLHGQLQSAIADPNIPSDAKTICTMLDRVLTDPKLQWNEVYFAEKWE